MAYIDGRMQLKKGKEKQYDKIVNHFIKLDGNAAYFVRYLTRKNDMIEFNEDEFNIYEEQYAFLNLIAPLLKFGEIEVQDDEPMGKHYKFGYRLHKGKWHNTYEPAKLILGDELKQDTALIIDDTLKLILMNGE